MRPGVATRWARAAGRLCVALAAAGFSTQRWPAPMEPVSLPLPPGDGADRVPGIEEVEVIRHADPVQLRRANSNAAFPMRFWDKKERARAGAWVLTDSGGRAELLWPRDGTSLVLFERGVARIGERDRDEPAVTLRSITRAKLQLGPNTRAELEGGALLRGDDAELSGPFVLERLPVGNILRLYNKAKHTVRVEYREAVLPVGPGQVIDLPVLDAGSGPLEVSSAAREVVEPPLALTVEGPVAVVEDPAPGTTLEAAGTARVTGRGVEVRLGPGSRARFTSLARRSDTSLAPPAVDAGLESAPVPPTTSADPAPAVGLETDPDGEPAGSPPEPSTAESATGASDDPR